VWACRYVNILLAKIIAGTINKGKQFKTGARFFTLALPDRDISAHIGGSMINKQIPLISRNFGKIT